MYENRLKFYTLSCEQQITFGAGREGRSRAKRVLHISRLYFEFLFKNTSTDYLFIFNRW